MCYMKTIELLKTIEIFAGSCSFSKVAKELGHDTFTTDYEEVDGQDLVADIQQLEATDFPYCHPDILWASPPCEGFSVASISANWTGGHQAYIPKSDTARQSINLVNHTLRLIEELQPKYYFIENPRGVLKKLDLLKHVPFMHTIWYCKYGDDRAKPTNIWTNAEWWTPRPVCKNHKYDKEGNIINRQCHHESARRGAKTGTQGRGTYKDRSRIPEELFYEIFNML